MSTAKRPLRSFVRADGHRFQGEQLLGAGGQGEVWRATLDGVPVAVKVYHRHTAHPKQQEILQRLVNARPPSPAFLWPLAMVTAEPEGTFGYVMALREPRFRSVEDFMARRFVPSLRALITAAHALVDAFQQLHSRGLCYRDISFANVSFDPHTGEVRICDNDNVDHPGAGGSGVLGTPRFMAPEVVRGEASPSDDTDRYSLAVLLFYLLLGGHPLDGEREAQIRCLDLPALERLYGRDPLYIFDPADTSNRPRRGVHDNPIAFHDIYPQAIRDLFLRSFTEGLRLPKRRVLESEWRRAFARARDALFGCSGCGAELFFDAQASDARCWACGRAAAQPLRVRLGAEQVVLGPHTRLTGAHLGRIGDAEAAAEVVRHPAQPGQLGLKNLGVETWVLERSDGTRSDVPPGRSALIVSGHRIHFGTVTGEIQQ